MFRCYCNQCENGGYVEPNYGSAEKLAEDDVDFVGPSLAEELAELDAGDQMAEFDAGFVGPLQPWFFFGKMDDPIPF